MKSLKSMVAVALLAGLASLTVVGCKTADNDHDNYSSSRHASGRAYPLKTCVVSGDALEEGKEYTFVRNGQEVKLCCKDCLAEFNKNPDKFMAKIDESK
jgi:YHS domain-containing protein